jgi:hypothetical protein
MPTGSSAFLLAPVDKRITRLVVRSRSGATAGAGRILFFDPIHFVMERKMMLGIRDRAEERRVVKAALVAAARLPKRHCGVLGL